MSFQFEYSQFELCNSTQIETYNNFDPCIIDDGLHSSGHLHYEDNSTLTMVTVSPLQCGQHHEGVFAAIERLNSLNDGKGFTVGFESHKRHLRIRLVRIIAGDVGYHGRDYLDLHGNVLRAALAELKPQYIVGACSLFAGSEPTAALDHKTILIANVGPPTFYQSQNPWLFGMHLNSNTYVTEALRQLKQAQSRSDRARFPVHVIYRTSSDFFFQTCQSVIDDLEVAGFKNITKILYDPLEDHNGDGTTNEFDATFWNPIVDHVCPSNSPTDYSPAFFMCTREAGTLVLDRLKQNHCRPSSMWLASAVWGWWTAQNQDDLPFILSGAQWHPAMKFSDEFYPSGQDLLDEMTEYLGYSVSFNTLATYAAVMVVREHLRYVYEASTEVPNPVADFADPTVREFLRRKMKFVQADTLFGPVKFDPESQQNVGREAAGIQWLPDDGSGEDLANATYEIKLVSPLDQAESNARHPVPTSELCAAGSSLEVRLFQASALLSSKCQFCPFGTVTTARNLQDKCELCPAGTTTKSTGATACVCINCPEIFDLEFSPIGLPSPGCLAFEPCGSIQQMGSIRFQAIDNLDRGNVTVSVTVTRDGNVASEYLLKKQDKKSVFGKTVYGFEYSAFGSTPGTALLHVSVDSEPIAQNPVFLEILPRDCAKERSDPLMVPTEFGNCHCKSGSFLLRSKCINVALFALIVLVPTFLVCAVLFLACRYVQRKREQARSAWKIRKHELHGLNESTVLGRGTFGVVLEARYRGTTVAVKRVLPPQKLRTLKTGWSLGMRRMSGNSSNEEDWFSFYEDDDEEEKLPVSQSSLSSGNFKLKKLRKKFIEEVKRLSTLQHPSLVGILGAVVSEREGGETLLVMEHMEYGSLYDLLQNESAQIEEDVRLAWLRDVASGLSFLHAQEPSEIIHGDLASPAVLVNSRPTAKLTCPGFTQKNSFLRGTQGVIGTMTHMAPELISEESPHSAASDVYAFGCLVYEMFTRKEPYDGEELSEVLHAVSDPAICKRPTILTSGEKLPPIVAEIMAGCFRHCAPDRMASSLIARKLKLAAASYCKEENPVQRFGRDRRTEALLYQIFPRHVADALKEGRKVEPEHHNMVSVFFSDIVGYTTLAAEIGPIEATLLLDRLYTKLDQLCVQYDVFKVETIGDAFMAVTNLHKSQSDHACILARFALAACQVAAETMIDPENPSSGTIDLRVGIHSGPCVTHVIGCQTPRYSVIGDTVNVASRMESHSLPGRIHCSSATSKLIQLAMAGAEISLRKRGVIQVKGKGRMRTYWIGEDGSEIGSTTASSAIERSSVHEEAESSAV